MYTHYVSCRSYVHSFHFVSSLRSLTTFRGGLCRSCRSYVISLHF